MGSVMVIAPHPDDAELGMGGTIAALSAKGVEVTLLDLTNGEPTPFGTPEKRAKEAEEARAILGATRRVLLDIPNRALFDSEENRRKVAGVIREFRPTLLFVPYWEDAHPDHWQACQLGEASRFWAKLTKADLPHDPHYPMKVIHFFSTHIRVKAEPSFVYDTSSFQETKEKAIRAYESQFITNEKNQVVFDHVENENRYWGRRTGTQYGEPFLCREAIKIGTPDSLLSI